MITDLVQIQRLGEKKRPENEKFRKHIKTHNYVVRRFKQLAEEVEEAIDCTECANCCRVANTPVTTRDVQKLAKFLGTGLDQFLRDYTMLDAEDGRILKREEGKGCVFLNGNLCSVYEARPSNCELFPHTVKGEGSIPSRTWQFIDRATYCPIVYNTLEAWKEESGFRPSA
jgi:Fe-S-cluster containining protein